MFGFLLFCPLEVRHPSRKGQAGSVAELTARFPSSDEKGRMMVSSRPKIWYPATLQRLVSHQMLQIM